MKSDLAIAPLTMKKRPSLEISVTHHNPTITIGSPETRPYVKNPEYTWEQLQKLTLKQKQKALAKSANTRLKLKNAINNLENKLEKLEQLRKQRTEIYNQMKDPKLPMNSIKWNTLNTRAKKLTAILSLYDDIKINLQKLKQRFHLEEKNQDLIYTNLRRGIL